MQDRVYGMYVGGALGDALGAPHEFNNRVQYTGNLIHKIIINSRFQGLRESSLGQITDDTQMTIALIKALVDKDLKYDKDTVIKHYLEFANNCSFIGRNTRNLMYGVKTVKGYNGRFAKIENMDDLQSNGCLMRAAPLAFASNMEEALTDYYITNPNVVCKDATYLYIKLVHLALYGQTDKAINFAKEYNTSIPSIRECIDDALIDKVRDIKVNKGWVCHALYCTIRCLLHCSTYTEAISWTILLGGDTDTNAAIVGSLLGTVYGYNAIKETEENNINIMYKSHLEESKFRNYYTFNEGCEYINKAINLLDAQSI